jgi:TP901 family phage tail tape measure protein
MAAGRTQHNLANQESVEQARRDSESVRAQAAEQDRITKETARKAARTQRIADAAAKRTGTRGFNRALRHDDAATKLALRANEAEAAAAKAIPDRTAREAELNRVLAARQQIHRDSAARLSALQSTASVNGNEDHAAKADAARLKALDAAGKAGVGQVKADADAQTAAHRKTAADAKTAAATAHADREAAFKREFQDIAAASAKRISAINSAERAAKAATDSAAKKAAIAKDAHLKRSAEYGDRSNAYASVEGRARAAGHTATADAARGKSLGADVTRSRDMDKHAAATTKSGHALDFHSSSLLRNAATFLKWQVPMQAVMSSVQAFSAGFAGAMKVDRQFATLRAVFNGTAEEAQKLKNGTLELAAAEGRSSEEAMATAIRWSRLGLTKNQVLQATKVSLVAANVAEIDAAEATEKLSAIYATFKLNVGDLGTVLNRLNSISNNYNVTVDDMFEGIVRVGGVAKQSGLALRDLEGIIGSVVGATGRPGAEVGNALKFVITRLASPDTMENLKKSFNIDLTQPNGDLKDMSQIFRQLADIYPTLNGAQQQYFLKLTSGSRQAARFALVLDQFRQGQILAAGAAFDASSAFRENQMILESLQSRVESLKTSWTSLFATMGDAGVFEFLGARLRALKGSIDEVANAFPKGKKEDKQFKINDTTRAERVENLGGGWDKVWGTGTDFSEQELLTTISRMDTAIKAREELDKKTGGDVSKVGFGDKHGKIVNDFMFPDEGQTVSSSPLTVKGGGLKFDRFESLEAAKKERQMMLAALDSGGDSGPADKLSAMTAELNALRERLTGLDIAADVFGSMNKSIESGKVERVQLIKDFEGIAALLPQMEGGAATYTDAVDRFYRLLDAKDFTGMAALLKELEAKTKGEKGKKQEEFTAQKNPVLESLRADLVASSKRKSEATRMPQGTDGERKARIAAIQTEADTYKNLQSAIEQVTQAMEKQEKPAFNGTQTSNIDKYLDDLLAQAAAVGEAFRELSPDAANDPVARIFRRKRDDHGKGDLRGDGSLGLDWLKQVGAATAADANEKRASARANIRRLSSTAEGEEGIAASKNPVDQAELETQQQILLQADAAEAMAMERIATEEKRIAQLVRELDFQEQIARLARTQTDASKRADNSSRAWRFGDTDSDKDANQAEMAMRRAAANINAAETSAKTTSPSDKANLAGSILQDEATARTNLNALEQRNYDLDAARKQVAIDQVKAMKEQTEEANKRLMLASREDQLRASVLARSIRDKGPLGKNEFFALSQETRQAIVNYNPGSAPDALNPAKETARKSSIEITEEQTRLQTNVSKLDAWLEALAKRITSDTGRGGPLNVTPPAPVRPLLDAANPSARDGSPVVNIQLGDVSVSVQLSAQVEKMMTGYVDRKINSDLRAMEARLSRPAAPNGQGASER